jgi:hypothetical protein
MMTRTDELLKKLRATAKDAREGINDQKQQAFYACIEECASHALEMRGDEEPTNPGAATTS